MASSDDIDATITKFAADLKRSIDDTEFMPTVVAVIIEGYEADSTVSLSVIHTADSPWRLIGLLEYHLARLKSETA